MMCPTLWTKEIIFTHDICERRIFDYIMNNCEAKQKKDKGTSFLRNIVTKLDDIADAIAEREFQREFLQVVTWDDCVRYYREEAKKLQGLEVAGFILVVKKNLNPRNENDKYVVVLGLVDKQNRPIKVNNETISKIVHTKTIDDALIMALNGRESVIVRA